MVGIGGNQVSPDDVAGMLAGLESNAQDTTMSGVLSGVLGGILGGFGLSASPFGLSNLTMQGVGKLANANLRNQINTELGRTIGDLNDPDPQNTLQDIDEGIGMTTGQPGLTSDPNVGIVGETGVAAGPPGSADTGGPPGSEGGVDAGPSTGGPGDYHTGGVVTMNRRIPELGMMNPAMGMMRQMGLVPGGDENRNGRRNVPIMAEEGERVIPAKKRAGGMSIRPGGRSMKRTA